MLAVRTQKRGNWENKRKKKSKIPASLGKDFSTAMNAEKLRRTGICPAPQCFWVLRQRCAHLWKCGQRGRNRKKLMEGETNGTKPSKDIWFAAAGIQSVSKEGKKLSPIKGSCSWDMSEQHICLLTWVAHHSSYDAVTKAQISATGLLTEE